MPQLVKSRTDAIRGLNDKLRKESIGGTTMITHGVQSLDRDTIYKVMTAIRAFDNFSEDNDPYGEHDFAAIEVEGHRVFFKIDYYDQSLRGGSPDPADPSVTQRVMTVMLADEY